MPIPPSKPALVAVLTMLLCVAAAAVPLRVATFNIELGLEAQGTTSHDSVADVLARIDADVVTLQEVRSQDVGTNIDALAATLGYAHQYVGVPDSGEPSPLDTNNRNVFLSRYPITAVDGISSPSGAKDMTRVIPAVVVDVPGTTADPTIIGLHLKCCGEPDDPYRRAVELDRVVDYLVANSLTASDNVIILGDFNLVTGATTYNSEPAGLPASYITGADITFPVEYDPDPAFYFGFVPMVKLQNFQADGVTDTTQGSSAVLDHILVSPAIANRTYATEIYNSAQESSHP
ncbi:MAG: endonuclease/exonuclease/phosphatase family protein, partial [Akkermansiaceae bacterium]|nr:endonuclease/exonuclease/phosphatase family protein [Akkermansiaceae bacterium]